MPPEPIPRPPRARQSTQRAPRWAPVAAVVARDPGPARWRRPRRARHARDRLGHPRRREPRPGRRGRRRESARPVQRRAGGTRRGHADTRDAVTADAVARGHPGRDPLAGRHGPGHRHGQSDPDGRRNARAPGRPAAPSIERRRRPSSGGSTPFDPADDPGRLRRDPVGRRALWLGASGRTDAAGRSPMTTGTAFALASISKTFTGGRRPPARRRGRLGLDQRVAPLLPSYRLDRRITVRMLLDHTSGLPDFFWPGDRRGAPARPRGRLDGPAYVGLRPQASPHARARLELLEHQLPAARRARRGRSRGTRSPTRSAIGSSIRSASTRPGTRGSRSRGRRARPGSGCSRPRAASGRVPVAPRSDVMPFRSVVTAAGGAGSIAATARDTARWMRAFAGGRLLSPAVQAEMIGDMARTRVLKARIPYGLGIQGVPLAGRPALGHSGRYLGFRNVVRYLPDGGGHHRRAHEPGRLRPDADRDGAAQGHPAAR